MKVTPPWSLERQSALRVAAEIKPSMIPNGGNGRFTKQAVEEGTVLMKSKCVSAEDPDIFGHNVTIKMESVEEMVDVMTRFKQHTDESEDVILSKFADFLYSVPDVTHGRPRGHAWILGSSFHINHSSSDSNVCFTFASNRHFYVVATRDLSEGEEMYIDYEQLQVPSIFAQYLESQGTPSINVFVDSISGDS